VNLDGESYYGTAFISRLNRRARHLNFTIDYNQVSPTYRTQSGFDPWVNYRNITWNSWYTIYPENSIFQRITPQLHMNGRWGFDGKERWKSVSTAVSWNLAWMQTSGWFGYEYRSETWFDMPFDDLWDISGSVSSRFSDRLGGGVSVGVGKDVDVFAGTVGDQLELGTWLDLKPVDRMTIEPEFDYIRSDDETSGEMLFEQYILRTRLRLQATRQLSLRLVIEHNNSDGAFSWRRRRAWDVDPLITYRLNSFSVLYMGSTHDYRDLGYPRYQASDWEMTQRQFFVKLQYLFQV
jgi:hypothetical protein